MMKYCDHVTTDKVNRYMHFFKWPWLTVRKSLLLMTVPILSKIRFCITGHQQYKYDLQHFQNLQHGGPCTMTIPPTCTILPISKLKWSLHGHHEYYFTIKATNVVGLSVLQSSVAYNHNVQRPSEGIVFDISSQYMSSRHTIVS